jgi:hypothetical protein
MSKQGYVSVGEVAFSNLKECDVYKGKSTGRYSVVITMDGAQASTLEDMGVRIKQYKEKQQRKFSTQWQIPVIDMEGDPVAGELPFGTKVKVLWSTGDMHPENGQPTYLEKVRVVELAEKQLETPEEF